MNVLSLFAGVGGLDLGLERAGMTIVGQVEIDPWCRRVLGKHWPEVPRHDDVRTCPEWWTGTSLADTDSVPRRGGQGAMEAGRQVVASEPGVAEPGGDSGGASARANGTAPGGGRPRVDLVAGGFPCQPVSTAGKRLAQADSRWLWPAFARVIRHLRPRYVLVENVPGLLGRGMGDVLGDLAALGYDAWWDSVPAAFVGAPHIRNRIWIVAYPAQLLGDGGDSQPEREVPQPGDHRGPPGDVADAWLPGATRHGEHGRAATQTETRIWPGARQRRAPVADADGEPVGRTPIPRHQHRHRPAESRMGRGPDGLPPRLDRARLNAWQDGWEDGIPRVATGVPHRVDRLRGLGNAVVPQVAQYVGELIMGAAS